MSWSHVYHRCWSKAISPWQIRQCFFQSQSKGNFIVYPLDISLESSSCLNHICYGFFRYRFKWNNILNVSVFHFCFSFFLPHFLAEQNDNVFSCVSKSDQITAEKIDHNRNLRYCFLPLSTLSRLLECRKY